ncbi:UNVERIFIED_CONTAM: hypothetical protein Sradi_3878600 [Sesamum radiatum]|uniref:Integrase catalytic domain-containing protein n=1 Tax=Sesamum radiatum TaxID=300843 RepID=A0AAW2Q2J0_SESRA
MARFVRCRLKQIPREANSKADELAKMGSHLSDIRAQQVVLLAVKSEGRSRENNAIHGNLHHTPAVGIELVIPAWPFDHWGLDIIGPFPPAQGQKKFVLVAVDHFTKWIEAEPLTLITEETIIKFLWQNLLCRFGIPQKITTDNGTQFQGRKTKEWCAKWNIKQIFTSVGNPKANGQTEVSNRIILQNLKTKLGLHKRGWLDELPGVLWAYRTTTRTSTGETPFSLAYGSEALIPAEVTEPTIRVLRYDENRNEKGRCLDLDLVDEKRKCSKGQAENYKKRMIKRYNARVKERPLQVGDLVL